MKQLIALCFLLFLNICTASGQQAPPPLRITLRDAVQLALKQNPQVQVALLNTAQSEQDRAVARSALLPQITAETFERDQRLNLQAFIGRSFPGTPQHAGPFGTFQIGPTFSIPVLDLTLWRRYQAQGERIKASQARERTVREQIVLLVVSQYLGSMRAAADVRASQARVELAKALYDRAADLQKQGAGTGIDTLRANVEYQNERQRLIGSETELKTSLYALARLLSIDPRQEVELADAMSFFETPPPGSEQSLDTARANRPEMKALEAQEHAALFQKKEARDSRLPTLRGNGYWSEQGLTPSQSIPGYTYQITADMPMFTGGRIRAEETRADLEIKKIREQMLDLGNQIAMEVKTALAELESARHQVDVANEGVRLAGEEVTQARDRFQAGVANNIEVITAQEALARANDNQIAALYLYNQARANLAHSTGQIENLYAK